ncbi:MAG: DUF839 domain-containing protein [Planctomycetota bacterium]
MNSRRRDFLSAATFAAAALAAEPFESLSRRAKLRAEQFQGVGYGPLRPTKDETTGHDLLLLPEGFRYVSFGWTGDLLDDGSPTPGAHDGMAALSQDGSLITLVRNHEVGEPGPSMADASLTYDPQAGGGCTRLVFDGAQRKLVSATAVLGGTHRNCAGGPTPWGTWLSCEETVDDAHGSAEGKPLPFEKDHGYIFEVPSNGAVQPTPLRDMGRFVHEAVAVDPATGIVYETEDQHTAGFYRFLPKTPGKLEDGGHLQMMKAEGRTDLRQGATANESISVRWVDIVEPGRHHSPGTNDGLGVFTQGKIRDATTFARLEGCYHGGGKIYFVSTSGGDARLGQIWEYDPKNELLRLVFESPSSHILDYPDNVTMSPRGGLVLCEDGDQRAERLCGLTLDGQLFPLAQNNMVLAGQKNGFTGDFRTQEWCGTTFSPDGQWLFANLQTPGLTVAITGPWNAGPL